MLYALGIPHKYPQAWEACFQKKKPSGKASRFHFLELFAPDGTKYTSRYENVSEMKADP